MKTTSTDAPETIEVTSEDPASMTRGFKALSDQIHALHDQVQHLAMLLVGAIGLAERPGKNI